MAQMLIDESKEPQGYFVAETCLDVVGHNIAVGKVGNLLEALPFATNLESVLLVNQQVALWSVVDGVTV